MSNYFIWSNEHCAWWGANEMGYTIHRAEAGKYSKEQALEISYRFNAYRSPTELPKALPILIEDSHVISGGKVFWEEKKMTNNRVNGWMPLPPTPQEGGQDA